MGDRYKTEMQTMKKDLEKERDLIRSLKDNISKKDIELKISSEVLETAKEEITALKEVALSPIKNVDQPDLQYIDESNHSESENIQELDVGMILEKEDRHKQLVKENSTLKDEIIELRERLESAEIDQNRLEMERTDKEIAINEEKNLRNESTMIIKTLE